MATWAADQRQGEQEGSFRSAQPHSCLPCLSDGSSGGGSAAPGLWSPVQAEQSQHHAARAPWGSPLLPTDKPYPEQQGECLRLVRPFCEARLHPVHCKLQDLIQLLPWGHKRGRLSHFPASPVQEPPRSACSLTCWVLVHQPCKALGSCGGREGTVAGATQCQQFPEQPFLLRNYHLRETGSVLQTRSTAAPFLCPWSLLWIWTGWCSARALSTLLLANLHCGVRNRRRP